MSLEVSDRGRLEYGKALEIQRSMVERRSQGRIGDVLLLLEHDHVITLGRKTSPENLKAQPIPVFQVERGGDATYHGPGQLVGYPIVLLKDHDVVKYVRMLEEVLIRTASDFGIDGKRKEGKSGVWVDGRKVAAVGVSVVNWVTFHGFALNVNTDLSYFSLIRPCGMDPDRVTSMKEVLGRSLEMSDVKRSVASRFPEVFGLSRLDATGEMPPLF